MKNSDLARWSGATLMLGGILVAVSGAIHPLGETSAYYGNGLWLPSHLMGYFGLVLSLLGLIGLYVRHAEKAGRLGLLGLVLVFVGGVTFAGGLFWEEVVLGPVLAVKQPALIDSFKTPSSGILPGPVALASAVLGLSFFAGYVILGVALNRAAVLPRWVFWLLIASIIDIITLLLAGFGAVPVLVNTGITVLGLTLTGWGYAFWAEKPRALPALPGHEAS